MKTLLSLGAVITAAVALAISIPAPVMAVTGPGWTVAPADGDAGSGRANFDYSIDAGAVIRDGMTVSNTGAVALTLDVYAADAFTSREGQIDLLPAGTESVDSGTWVSVDQPTITLEPGQETTVGFTVSVPADARPGDHPTGLVTSMRSADTNATVQVDRRLGSRMQIRVAGVLEPGVRVGDVTTRYDGSWNPFGVGAFEVAYTLTNDGNTRATGTSRLVVGGPFGLATTSTPAEQLPEVLPGSTIDVRQRIDGVAALLWLSGAVEVVPVGVGIGGAPLDAELLEYSTPAVPWIIVIALVVLAAILLVIVVVVRRRRGRRAAVLTPAAP